MQWRLREGLRSFPGMPRSGSSCPAPDQTPLASDAGSPSRVLSAVSTGRLSDRRTLAPSIERHLAHADLTNRISHLHALAAQNINLTQLRNNLLGLVCLLRHNGPPS